MERPVTRKPDAPQGAAATPVEARPSRRGAEWLLISLFFLVLWLPRLQMTFSIFPSTDVHENRRLAAAPRASLRNIPGYLRSYGRYFTDNFGLRGALVRTDSAIRLKWLHSSPVSRLIFGKDGWIFYNSDVVPDGITIRDFRGLAVYTSEELKSLLDQMERRDRWCRERGIACYFVIVPNKETIYPEYLPSSIRRMGQVTRLDQIVKGAQANPAIRLIDLRADLLRAKTEMPYPIYFRGGTHWNQYGAYQGYRSIVARLHEEFPELRAHELGEYEITLNTNSPEDHWLELKENVSAQFRLKTDTGGGTLEKAVVIHDSFWDQLEPFLAPHFRNLVAQHTDQNREISREILERERPKIVIYEIAERYADRILRQDGF